MSEEIKEGQESSEKEQNQNAFSSEEGVETTKRPRIRQRIPHAEKVVPFSERRSFQHDGDYQRTPREYQHRDNNYHRENSYQGNSYHRENNYQGENNYQREGAYRPRPRNYNPSYHNDNYGQSREQYPSRDGYNRRPDYREQQNGEGYNRPNPYNRPRYDENNDQGSYNNGYNRRPQGGYQRRPAPYGQPRDNYNRVNDTQEGGYRPNNYGPRQDRNQPYDRYSQNRRPGGYNNHEGGYQQNRPPRFQQRPRRNNFMPVNSAPKPVLRYKEEIEDPTQPLRLNKFFANAGICSRREADKYIQAGVITVNGEVVTELGTKVKRTDEIKFHDQTIKLEDKIYVLLNKPKDYVTTSDDPMNRKTVMDLVKNACPERIYPIGRLDRNTTGVLLLTNDGDMASKLMHPKFMKKKIYHVHLSNAVTEADLKQIRDGIELEDGVIKADAVEYANEMDKKEVGIEIHSGKNRIVRRIFEHLGYRVVKLDRVYFAGLTKKNLRRGEWRFLTEDEVNRLRMGAFE